MSQIEHVLDKALAQGGLTLKFADKALAVSWRHRAYRFRVKNPKPGYENIFITLKGNELNLKVTPPLIEDPDLAAEATELAKWANKEPL